MRKTKLRPNPHELTAASAAVAAHRPASAAPPPNADGPRDSGLLRRLAEIPLDAFFPPRCPACGNGMARHRSGGALCEACERDLPRFDADVCPRCSLPLGEGVAPAGCPDCARGHYAFARTWALGPHWGILQSLVHRAKYRHAMPAAIMLGQRMASTFAELRHADALVVPAPMHWWPKLRRTYNQAEVIAQAMAKPLRLATLPQIVSCKRMTASQVGMSYERRCKNVKGAFAVHPRARLRGRRILLVDDVMTSGATANEAARALRRAGAREVWVAVASRAVTGNTQHARDDTQPIDEFSPKGNDAAQENDK